jgi:hypothetical protein
MSAKKLSKVVHKAVRKINKARAKSAEPRFIIWFHPNSTDLPGSKGWRSQDDNTRGEYATKKLAEDAIWSSIRTVSGYTPVNFSVRKLS